VYSLFPLHIQIMGNLPAHRLKMHRPFLICGVDLCGPFVTTLCLHGKPLYKTYIALFICFSTKAIHLQLVSDLSTNTFILALKRFISRRGRPNRIYCDNATHFVGTNNYLSQFRSSVFNPEKQGSLLDFASSN